MEGYSILAGAGEGGFNVCIKGLMRLLLASCGSAKRPAQDFSPGTWEHALQNT